MIKEIQFKDIYDKDYIVPLKPGVNLIVGPKGGGKSSLLNLLAGANKGVLDKDLKKYFSASGKEDNAPLKPHKLVYVYGEEKNYSSLQELTTKAVEAEFDDIMSIIRQNDKYKYALDQSKDIEKFKKKFVEMIVLNENDISEMYSDIEEFKISMQKLLEMKRIDINWDNIFKFKAEIKSKNNFLTDLVYKNDDIERMINQSSSIIDTKIRNNSTFLSNNRQITADINTNKLDEIISIPTMKKINENNKKINDILEDEQKVLNSEKLSIEKLRTTIDSFTGAYLSVTKFIKEQSYSTVGLESFRNSALEYFFGYGKQLKNIKNKFDNLISAEYKLKINKSEKEGMLTFKLSEDIIFEDDELNSILSYSLYAPKTKTDYIRYVEDMDKKGTRQNSGRETFNKMITKVLVNKVKVFADNKDYFKMSPGQKSIFGIKYKLLNANEEDILFIDQPEDNLDNHTIAEEVLGLLAKSKHKQIIIVTHNANLGILTKPSNVIVANINGNEDPYATKNYSDIVGDPKAYYLEGGEEKLINRYKEIIEKGGN